MAGGNKIERFEDLKCWQAARELVTLVYTSCRNGMIAKDYGLQDQLKRAAVSIMNNIAEGFTRYHRKEFKHFLDIAQSSAAEVQSMSYVCNDLEYWDNAVSVIIRNKAQNTRILILGLIKHISKPEHPNTRTPEHPNTRTPEHPNT